MQPIPTRFATSSFAAATSSSAHRLPYSHRHPTAHLAVVLGPAPVPLLRHAHSLLLLLSGKGFHVFLQTEIDRPPPQPIAPVTHDAIPDLAAASPADFFLVITDANFAASTVQVRFPTAPDFHDVFIPDLPDTLFASWSALLRTRPHTSFHTSLPANPNLFTNLHVDALLQAFSPLPHINRAYASLLRAAVLLHPAPPRPTFAPSPSSFKPSPSPTARTVNSAQSQSSASHSHPASSNIIDKALRRGLRTVFRLPDPDSPASSPPKSSSSSTAFSFSWLRRSTSPTARLLRSQILAVALHGNLVATFDTIASAPLSSLPTPTDLYPVPVLPTEAHRHRLLRQVNELLPRVEELGRRLADRLPTKRRRAKLIHSNPWNAYVKRCLASKESARRKEIASFVTTAAGANESSLRRCCHCRSYADRQAPECPACLSRPCITDTQWLVGNQALLRKSFQDALEAGKASPTPWVFPLGISPIQTVFNHGIPNGVLVPSDQAKRPSTSRSPPGESSRRFPRQPVRTTSGAVRNGVGMMHPTAKFDIANAMGSLTVDDQFQQPSRDGLRAGHGQQHEHPYPREQLPFGRGDSSSKFSQTLSPPRLATSVPNRPSFSDYDFQKRPANGVHKQQDADSQLRSAPHALRGSPPRKSNVEDLRVRGRPPGTMRVGSLPGSHFLSNLQVESTPPIMGTSGDTYREATQREDQVADAEPPRSTQPLRDVPIPSRSSFSHAGLKELAVGSYEASDKAQRYANAGRRAVSKPIAVPGATPCDSVHQQIDSLEALAAASDAANGGTGSATMESLRAVSAVVTPGRGHGGTSSSPPADGMYNMF
eukprot:GFKZ01014086.1.p1 GENE.GFKZ01014086.1~~GFKZ01014086.1.p1  ORF type:complete len:826 (+),score=68.29 GFKZ01014086.1:530-3007(+)